MSKPVLHDTISSARTTRAKFDQAACNTLAGCVKEIENATDAELVIVLRARSGDYARADYRLGALLAFAGLLFLLFSPVEFNQTWVAIDVALLFVLGAFISSRSNAVRRLLTRKKSRERSVRQAAAALFYEAGIANTNAEMGVLIYISLLERRLELIADRGVLKAVPALEWNQRLFELHKVAERPQLMSLLQELRKLGALLTKHLPASDQNPNELPDMPRFELR